MFYSFFYVYQCTRAKFLVKDIQLLQRRNSGDTTDVFPAPMIICFTLDLPQLMEALKAINTVGWWKTMPQTRPCLPPMTGNGKHTAYQNADDWGMVQMALVYPHETGFSTQTRVWMSKKKRHVCRKLTGHFSSGPKKMPKRVPPGCDSSMIFIT